MDRTSLSICDPDILRSLNAIGIALVLPTISYELYRRLHPFATKEKAADVALAVATFPLMFFFAGLFYTDVWSAIFVLGAYWAAAEKRNWIAAILSATSLLFRQTNILWTAFLLAHTLTTQLSPTPLPSTTAQHLSYLDVLRTSYTRGQPYNPKFTYTTLDDLLRSVISFIGAALHSIPKTTALVLPYATVMAGFIAFVIWNGGIVVGDKGAHPFTLHTPQVLYYTLFLTFTSWPLFLRPSLPLDFLKASVPIILPNAAWGPSNIGGRKLNEKETRLAPPLKARLVRTALTGVCVVAALGMVHFNTYFHPYLLADNRSYRFYLFHRTLIPYPLAKYAAVALYVPAGYLLFSALGQQSLVWVVAYTVAVAGTLVGAGLVEFRYFALAWMIWRLNVDPAIDGAGTLGRLGRFRRWVELAWFAVVNAVTVYIFLNWTFHWKGWEGAMRFMW
ncbi:hypothetical protein BJ508DRAFT_44221 [Ascobolus immersus RN42]|uniref:Dol-P-Glc:Glc(2)Man(9)GlcNAc(2)-PP-Dol alpha-1,2-glucosyltransferase n=1 Tax=Ascobolus immersus RN42 TaxID=1160509 RepID=A0A3N4HW84_ASCIM|nr:hypothetical protein BJ508DRAFT_44221 [Ascobolus immersus RN42]